MALDIHRQIPASFERVERSEYGYNAKQVDQFLQRARVSLETPEAATDPVKSSDVRAVSFDPVKGGYSAAVVDAALDRLEDAFARRERDELIAARGEEAWLREIGNLSGILRGRLHRPDGDRFRRPSQKKGRSYNTHDVDRLCHELIAYLEQDKPLSVDSVRRAVFRPAVGQEGYEESQVDAFLDRVVELMAAID
ncbi:DivIVA domain-containing protein [Arthrobacter sp. FW306-05-C]|uniref:DivIVA domain-containing protein n=1 Tax=Arthrobacter TaxID=1663 RepID=UPI001EF019FD|nr:MULTISPECIES: DivIVA domain-containing protein [Arthrobacter]MDP9988082.1 DivIVA domain-containing protein [Arthrobacter oryzae]UKA68057.1 DivIVA domain-containing protein [Arthrobacter sp. FW306-05-C]UKA72584.1 DivIVA domain-containing protein [Arthrobacter sp. FW306-06-A]UKA76815.1 DivIVA domain-containing protein [Arthrobacter sp. FW306-07-I]